MFLEQKVDFRLKLILTNTFYNSMGYICPIDKVHKKMDRKRKKSNRNKKINSQTIVS